MGKRSRVVVTVLALLCGAPGLSGCGGGESSSGAGGDTTTTTTSCAPGELTRDDGTCQPAGAPDEPCPPGELLLEDGNCQRAGVPASACGAGFMPDGKEGCEAILPADPCPPGQMAVPGDTECREVSPCGSGTWGDIPVEANTQFVDKAYAGGNSDGSMEKPWTTVQQGVAAAVQGAVVAVAAGSYPEDVKIAGKAVRLWGRCPAMVEIAGTKSNSAAVGVLKNAGGTEIHGVALTGASAGLYVSGSTDIEAHGVWIHDTTIRGLAIQDDLGVTGAVVEGSLVEQCHEEGVLVAGAEATIEATAVRGTLPVAQGADGRGIQIQEDPDSKVQAKVNVRGFLVEQNYKVGVDVVGAEATIEATVVRSTLLDSKGENGRGIGVENGPVTGLRGSLVVRACLVEQNHEVGVFAVGADATIESTVVRSTLSNAKGLLGYGIDVDPNLDTKARANVTVRQCLVDQNEGVGASIKGSDATLDATVVRSTTGNAMGEYGRGISIEDETDTEERAKVTVRACVVEQNHELGVQVVGSDATIETTVVRSTSPDANGEYGRGINVVDGPGERANVAIASCLVEANHGVGVFAAGSDVTIETSTVRSTLPNETVESGRGIDLQKDPDTKERANATIRGCLVEQNREIGVLVQTSDATIEGSVVRDTAAMDDASAGDGIAVDNGTATLQDIAVTHNARAGISSFGGQVLITGAEITCNGFDLDGEPSPDGAPFSFDGSTGWQCSQKAPAACTELGDCSVLTSHLEPPQPLSPDGPAGN